MISIVVVSWNSGRDLEGCVESLAAARARSATPAELIVVDNDSEEAPGEAIRRLWPDVRLAVLSENVGFGPAVNHGAAHAKGEILLLVNPDARATGDAFGAIARALETHADWVAVAPRLIPLSIQDPESGERGGADTGGESQETFQLRRLPTLRQAARELLLIDRAFPGNRGRVRDRYLDRDRSTSFEVEQPAAAVLAVRRDAFGSIGGFDPRFVPAWWEDVDLCARLRRTGKIVYYPDVLFEHAGGASMRRLGYDRFLPVYYRNAIVFWRKHHGAAAAFLFRALVAAGMVLRALLLPLRPSPPRSRREAFRAYRGAFRAALS
ncbi:MAG TPA: glycosyltransferase [Thermoanaerobaculia bacterium]|nr:glycosyltransferase [Thermoanaerobaculia bacterium]